MVTVCSPDVVLKHNAAFFICLVRHLLMNTTMQEYNNAGKTKAFIQQSLKLRNSMAEYT
jgi:hypothetical protein